MKQYHSSPAYLAWISTKNKQDTAEEEEKEPPRPSRSVSVMIHIINGLNPQMVRASLSGAHLVCIPDQPFLLFRG